LNLVLTSAKGLEAKASAEFKELALLSGTKKVTLERSAYDGVVEVEVEDPAAILSYLADFVKSEPFKVRFIMRVIPVDKVIDTTLEQIKSAAKELAHKVKEGESFRITIEARDSPYGNRELIDSIADVLDREVDLENPDKVVFLQIFGEYSGISVIPPAEILSIPKLKRAV
jgi:tRNA acetyltransferase TAN1